MIRSKTLAALAVALTTAAGMAYAASGSDNDAMAITSARISLTPAIQAAEQRTNGRAARAEYEKTDNGRAYDVEVVSGPTVQDVKVDAQKRKVLASTRDRADHDDAHGRAFQALRAPFFPIGRFATRPGGQPITR